MVISYTMEVSEEEVNIYGKISTNELVDIISFFDSQGYDIVIQSENCICLRKENYEQQKRLCIEKEFRQELEESKENIRRLVIENETLINRLIDYQIVNTQESEINTDVRKCLEKKIYDLETQNQILKLQLNPTVQKILENSKGVSDDPVSTTPTTCHDN